MTNSGGYYVDRSPARAYKSRAHSSCVGGGVVVVVVVVQVASAKSRVLLVKVPRVIECVCVYVLLRESQPTRDPAEKAQSTSITKYYYYYYIGTHCETNNHYYRLPVVYLLLLYISSTRACVPILYIYIYSTSVRKDKTHQSHTPDAETIRNEFCIFRYRMPLGMSINNYKWRPVSPFQ